MRYLFLPNSEIVFEIGNIFTESNIYKILMEISFILFYKDKLAYLSGDMKPRLKILFN